MIDAGEQGSATDAYRAGTTSTWERRGTLIAFSVLLLLSLWLHLALHRYAFDDAYIHFRVADRLAQDGTPYFNAGEPVMASSSAVWTLLLWLLFLVPGPSPWIVAVLNGIVSASAAWIFSRLMRELTRGEAPAWLCWGFMLPGFAMLQYASLGLMETALALAVLGLACVLYARGRASAFLFFGAAPFLRPELAVFTILFLAHGIVRARAATPRRLIYAALGGLPFIAYELYYFGTIVPHTVVAKSTVYSLSYIDSANILRRHVESLFPWEALSWGRALDVVLLAGVVVLAIAGVTRRSGRPDQRMQIVYLLGLGGLLIAATYVASRGLVFPWYVPLVALPVGFTLYVLVGRTRWHTAYVVLLLAFGLPHAATLSRSLVSAAGNPGLYRYFGQNARARTYLEVGRQLHDQYPRARILSPEIGALGFAFPGRIIDSVGLISPQALRYHPMKVPEERRYGYLGSIPVGLVEDSRPELIVSLDVFVEALMRSDALADYVRFRQPIYLEEDQRFTKHRSLWWSRHLNVFVRRDVLTPAEDPPVNGPGLEPPID